MTVEVNPHGTSQYCSRCGQKGERFSYQNGKRIKLKWGKLFWCPHCSYEVNADYNGSVNVHHSFFNQWHWQPRLCTKRLSGGNALSGYRSDGRSLLEGNPVEGRPGPYADEHTRQSGGAIVGPTRRCSNPNRLSDMT